MTEQGTGTEPQAKLPQHHRRRRRQGWDAMSPFREDIDSLFDQFLPLARSGRDVTARSFRQLWDAEAPSMDLSETETGYELCFDVPGVKQENIEIKLAGDVLTVRGHMEEANEETQKRCSRARASSGQFPAVCQPALRCG